MRKKIILGVIISGILIYFLLKLTNPVEIINVLQSVPVKYIVISFALYLVSMIVRTMRFNFIIDTKLKLTQLFDIIAIHNLMINLIPLRLGEFSYVYLMKKKGVHISKGLSQLLTVRVYDVIMISLIFIVSSFLVINPPIVVSYYVKLSLIFLAVLLIGFFVFVRFDKKLIKFLKKINPIKWKVIKNLLNTIEDLIKNFKKSMNIKTALPLITYSFIIWISNYLMTYFLILGLGLPFNFWEVCLIFTFIIILIMLPLVSFSGFGVYEGGLTGGLLAFGIGLESAVASSFAFHIINIIFFLVFGIFGLIKYNLQK